MKTAAGDSVFATVQPGFIASLEPGTSVVVQISVEWTLEPLRAVAVSGPGP